ncbi:bifunctional 3-deoxy-7-phosphoheptulonate synthase/chorismate mutase type II [Cytophagales bacterium LB-30]|uniref:chorismate mutase n=1 Tax=Shiella aurantiaca TaxID=3058365 RepID=A0ABT8F893_9BACT|nr:bifunctional 3-deoxy-7-phosphoheptulonate synthase/chorismate mutase type II [Shiella aurantiaca]MDN4166503.1 bifunctional 3-deoxy-7-phosphoheptulonate synthase/chorismate mutase type II [Shiella aurantiaca]
MENWIKDKGHPWIISGPCSAESPEQLEQTCLQLAEGGIRTLRAGVWKPRTRPHQFEGVGAIALEWIKEIKTAHPSLSFAVEVATPEHVERCLKAGIDILWIGARTTVNPFNVQELADVLKGVNIPVLVKNPVNPDLALWMGAIERIMHAGITQIGAIHRGFSSFQKSKYRNMPLWQIPLELKTLHPSLPLICDPSHIAGKRALLQEIAQRAMDMNYDGLMIESHIHPESALSDAEQQLTPKALLSLLANLSIRSASSSNPLFINKLEELRHQIDQADREILEALASRMALVEQLGEYKKENNVAVFQIERWNEVFHSRPEWGKALRLSPDFVEELYKIIHTESIKIQTEVSQQNPSR